MKEEVCKLSLDDVLAGHFSDHTAWKIQLGVLATYLT